MSETRGNLSPNEITLPNYLSEFRTPGGGPGGQGGSVYAYIGLKKRGGVKSDELGDWIRIFCFRRLILFWTDKKNLFYELFSVSKQKVP